MAEHEHGCAIRTHVCRLHAGDDLRRALEARVEAHGFAAALVLTCVGSVQGVDLRLADESLPGPWPGPYEIVSLVGTLGRGGSHLHGAFADARGNVVGGHVRPGCIVHTTAEIVLGVLADVAFDRTFDVRTGFQELDVRGAQPPGPSVA